MWPLGRPYDIHGLTGVMRQLLDPPGHQNRVHVQLLTPQIIHGGNSV